MCEFDEYEEDDWDEFVYKIGDIIQLTDELEQIHKVGACEVVGRICRGMSHGIYFNDYKLKLPEGHSYGKTFVFGEEALEPYYGDLIQADPSEGLCKDQTPDPNFRPWIEFVPEDQRRDMEREMEEDIHSGHYWSP